MEGGTERDTGATDHTLVGYRFDLFAVCWAAATLFHMAGDQRPAWIPTGPLWTAVVIALGLAAAAVLLGYRRRTALVVLCLLIPLGAWLEAPVVGNHWVLAAAVSLAALVAAAVVIALGLAAAAVLLGYRRRTALVVLCLLIPLGAWLEAPVVGNHWVLAAAVSLAALVAAAVVRRASTPSDSGEAFWELFAPAARWTLLIAYAFAAFAKLNASFFDPSVSCAVYYQDQLVRSWGLGALSVSGQAGLGTIVAIGAALTELSVPVLLLLPRTRRAGVLLAMGFHWLLALDLSQHFWDFSAVLFAGFLLFLDDAVIDQVRQRLSGIGGAIRPQVRRALAGLGVIVCAVVIVGTITPLGGLVVVGGHVAWIIGGTGILVVVALAVFRAPPIASNAAAVTLRVQPALLAVLALVFFNGLTPYLELKTGFGWNMYSNLRTVAGESNHFLVPSTLDVTGLQSDRITIVDASDERLSNMIGSDYELVYSEFREYAHAFPEESVTYMRGGETVRADPIGDDPAGQGEVSAISARLQSFRVVDASGGERCQPVFSPAR